MSIIGCCWSHKGGGSVVIGPLLVVDLIMCLCVPFLLVFVSHLAFLSYRCLSCIVSFLYLLLAFLGHTHSFVQGDCPLKIKWVQGPIMRIQLSRPDTTITICSNAKVNEPVHEISNNVVCATSKASDQPAHTRSLIRAFASRLSIL